MLSLWANMFALPRKVSMQASSRTVETRRKAA
jgi:hypothetical protein